MVKSMGTYGVAVSDLWDVIGDLRGRHIGSMGIYVSVVWDLWDFQGLWDCGLGPVGFPWVYGIAVWDLWDA